MHPCPSPGEAEPEGAAGCRSAVPGWARPRREPHRGSPAAGRGAAARPRQRPAGRSSACFAFKAGQLGRALLHSAPRGSSHRSASCRSVGLLRRIFVVFSGRTRSTQKLRQTLSRRERVVRAGASISVPTVSSLAQAPAGVAAAGGGHSRGRFPPLSAPTGVRVESCPTSETPVPVPVRSLGGHHRPCPAAHPCRHPVCAGCASRRGSDSASAPALGGCGQLFAIYLSCPLPRCGAARRERVTSEQRRRRGGRQSSAAPAQPDPSVRQRNPGRSAGLV